jgi:hypothetical protein
MLRPRGKGMWIRSVQRVFSAFQSPFLLYFVIASEPVIPNPFRDDGLGG